MGRVPDTYTRRAEELRPVARVVDNALSADRNAKRLLSLSSEEETERASNGGAVATSAKFNVTSIADRIAVMRRS